MALTVALTRTGKLYLVSFSAADLNTRSGTRSQQFSASSTSCIRKQCILFSKKANDNSHSPITGALFQHSTYMFTRLCPRCWFCKISASFNINKITISLGLSNMYYLQTCATNVLRSVIKMSEASQHRRPSV